MEYRELGRTGLRVSVVGYGTAPLGDMFGANDEDAALQSAYRALDAGINFFDSSRSTARAGREATGQSAAWTPPRDHRWHQSRSVRA